MHEKLVTVADFNDYIEADLAKQLLEDFGIQAIVKGSNVSNIFAAISAVQRPKLQTMETNAKKAREILDANKNKE